MVISIVSVALMSTRVLVKTRTHPLDLSGEGEGLFGFLRRSQEALYVFSLPHERHEQHSLGIAQRYLVR